MRLRLYPIVLIEWAVAFIYMDACLAVVTDRVDCPQRAGSVYRYRQKNSSQNGKGGGGDPGQSAEISGGVLSGHGLRIHTGM